MIVRFTCVNPYSLSLCADDAVFRLLSAVLKTFFDAKIVCVLLYYVVNLYVIVLFCDAMHASVDMSIQHCEVALVDERERLRLLMARSTLCVRL